MFALWYLSLAVDELRKRYGWTFFDIFYKTNKTESNALDNKPANIAAAKKVEPPQPSVSKAAPKVTPVPVAKPAEPTPTPTLVPAPAPVAKPDTKPIPKPAPPVTEPPKPFATPLAPNPAPQIAARPEIKPATPAAPQKSFERNINDSMDKKFMEISKPKENGESLKNNLKNTTKDFLSGETNGQNTAAFKSPSNSSIGNIYA